MVTIEIPRIEVPDNLKDPLFDIKETMLPVYTRQDDCDTVFEVGSLSRDQQIEFSRPVTNDSPSPLPRTYFMLTVTSHDKQPVYEIPDKFRQFAGAIALIASHEHGAYPDSSYGNIRIDAEQRYIKPTGLLKEAYHKDCHDYGWNHVYLVSDRWPTKFRNGHEAQPYEITFMNGYVRHAPPFVREEGGVRTFLRVVYEHQLT